MKLSHAILEGAQIVKQGQSVYIQVENGQVCCCALGMAKLAVGAYTVVHCEPYDPYFNTVIKEDIENLFPILSEVYECFTSIRYQIIFWNDNLHLPPHEIAMRVASIECKLARGENLNKLD